MCFLSFTIIVYTLKLPNRQGYSQERLEIIACNLHSFEKKINIILYQFYFLQVIYWHFLLAIYTSSQTPFSLLAQVFCLLLFSTHEHIHIWHTPFASWGINHFKGFFKRHDTIIPTDWPSFNVIWHFLKQQTKIASCFFNAIYQY